jgi:hypothetical protein
MDRILITQLKLNNMNVNDLMNMNDMYYVGNIVDVDGNGWVSKAEAQSILDELMGDVEDVKPNTSYSDNPPSEYKDMMAQVGIKL